MSCTDDQQVTAPDLTVAQGTVIPAQVAVSAGTIEGVRGEVRPERIDLLDDYDEPAASWEFEAGTGGVWDGTLDTGVLPPGSYWYDFAVELAGVAQPRTGSGRLTVTPVATGAAS